jgi:DNA repair exonuclease SbcCD ATPase subunit
MPETLPTSPQSLRRSLDGLTGRLREIAAEREHRTARVAALEQYLSNAENVEKALQQLGDQLFGELARVIEDHLTQALQEVLGQPICLKVTQDFKRGAATLKFHLERGSEKEDIMKGTGGSVANILSVGLRLLALARLSSEKHRRFLILDEQDCWLAPDLVPKLVKIIHDAGRRLGFQVLMISHHASASFERYADRIYRFSPSETGVEVEREDLRPSQSDRE